MTATQTAAQSLNDICMDVMLPKRNNATVVANGVEVIKQGKPVTKKSTAPKRQQTAADKAFANIGKQVSNTMVSVGGSNAEPEKEDAAKYAAVTLAELSTSGNTLQSLAFNFLAGNIDASITADTLKDLPRALRNEKGAIVGLLGKKASDIRAAWEKEQASRKRLDRPTLRALWACVKEKKARGASETWQQKVAKILDGKQSDKMKVQMLRELIEG